MTGRNPGGPPVSCMASSCPVHGSPLRVSPRKLNPGTWGLRHKRPTTLSHTCTPTERPHLLISLLRKNLVVRGDMSSQLLEFGPILAQGKMVDSAPRSTESPFPGVDSQAEGLHQTHTDSPQRCGRGRAMSSSTPQCPANAEVEMQWFPVCLGTAN